MLSATTAFFSNSCFLSESAKSRDRIARYDLVYYPTAMVFRLRLLAFAT